MYKIYLLMLVASLRTRMARAKGDERMQLEETIRNTRIPGFSDQENANIDNVMAQLDELRILEDALGDNYSITGFGAIGKDKGKVKLHKTDYHDMADSPESLRSIALGRELAASDQDSLVDHNVRAKNSALLSAVDNLMSGQGYSVLGKSGLREAVNSDVMKQRALAMLLDSDRGYNRKTGAPFGEAGVDGGHIQPHNIFKELSSDPANIMLENKYENRIKGDAATDIAVAEVLAQNLLNKARAGQQGLAVYSPQAQAEMSAGPEIMRINRKDYLKAKRQGRLEELY